MSTKPKNNLLIAIIVSILSFIGITFFAVKEPVFSSQKSCNEKCIDLGYNKGVCTSNTDVSYNEKAGVCSINNQESSCVCSAK